MTTSERPLVALTIAGSDSGGGAGIQADIKAMEANGVFACSVITAVTAQNTRAVTRAYELPLDLIEAQIDAIFDDIAVGAVKTGMLSSSDVIRLVARKLEEYRASPLVIDPVMISKSGYPLLEPEAVEALRNEFLPAASLVTPNAHEAEALTGISVTTLDHAVQAAERILAMGPAAVLVKGGHLEGQDNAVDVFYDGTEIRTFAAPFIRTRNTHGTGCTYASAIAANLAKGEQLVPAIEKAKAYVTGAIRHGLDIGSGHGPTSHFYFLREPASG